MSKFEDNLWAELEREHGAALVGAPKRRRAGAWIGAAAGVAVLGAAAVVGPAYFGGTPPAAAYAIVDNPDGSVTLTIREVEQFQEATAKLRERGIRATAVPLRADCPGGEQAKTEYLTGQAGSTAPVEVRGRVGEEMNVWIDRKRLPGDVTLVLAIRTTDGPAVRFGDPGHRFEARYARGPLPACLPDSVTGPPKSAAPSR